MKAVGTRVSLGYSEVDITPAGQVELVGFDRVNNMSRGILHNLMAQIAIWQVADARFCIVAIDSLGFTVELTTILRDAISKKMNIKRDQIMVCFSHTHSAPNAATESDYFDFVLTQVIKGVDDALMTIKPVKAVWGNAISDIGINRRASNGILDQRMSILKVSDFDTDKMRLLLLRVTAHANVLTSDNYLISSDYFGITRSLLEKEYGCKIMLTQGASGNVRPKYQQSDAEFIEIHSYEASEMKISPDIQKQRFEESMEALNQMAASILNSVNTVIDDLIPQPINSIDMFSTINSFSSDVPTIEHAKEIADEALSEAGIDGSSWLCEVDKLRAMGILQQYSDIEIQYFALNNGCWCGVPNEIMCEIALDASKKVNDELLHLGGYTNGCDSYLPSVEEFRKGGYEVLWSLLLYYQYHGRVMPLQEDTADKLAEIVSHKWSEYKSLM